MHTLESSNDEGKEHGRAHLDEHAVGLGALLAGGEVAQAQGHRMLAVPPQHLCDTRTHARDPHDESPPATALDALDVEHQQQL